MADAQPHSRQQASIVGSCTVTDCRHNEERECHAGEILVQIGDGGAQCGTYEPESPRTRP
jgi:hypothetical protein